MTTELRQFSDGTSQRDRTPAALDPTYSSVDQRGTKDLLQYARRYAEQVRFINPTNKVDGTWSGLFDFNEEELETMVQWVVDPESVLARNQIAKRFSQPHFVLFLAFLKLLRHPQAQFDDLTKRHLDFYYRNVLQLKTKAGVPDRVHVLFRLTPDCQEHVLNNGTLLNAGVDSQGKDLVYGLEDEIVVNRGSVAEIRTIRVLKSIVGLKDLHEQFDRSDQGFEKLLRRALGDPGQDDPLPVFINVDGSETAVDITFLKAAVWPQVSEKKDEELDEQIKTYLLDRLCFVAVNEFRECLALHDREINKGKREYVAPTMAEWEHVYELIEKANRKKVTLARRETLHALHLAKGFDAMMREALGDPKPGDDLPPIQSLENLDQLYEWIMKPDCDPAFGKYIQDKLYMTVANFKTILLIKHTLETKGSGEPTADVSWDEVYRLVEKSWARKRLFKFPSLEKQKTTGIVCQTVLSQTAGAEKLASRFKPFGPGAISYSQNQGVTGEGRIGFAVASPLLELQEGKREITVNLVCDPEGYKEESLKEVLAVNPLPFDVSFSGKEQWHQADQVEFGGGGFVIQQELETYQHGLALVCTTELESFDRRYRFLQLADGFLYQILQVESPQRFNLRSVGKMSPTAGIKVYEGLELISPVPITSSLTYNQQDQTIVASQECFDTNHVQRYLKLANGDLYQVIRFIDAKRVGAVYRGASAKPDQKYWIGDAVKPSNPQAEPLKCKLTAIVVQGSSTRFDDSDLNRLILWENGKVFRIVGKLSGTEVKIEEVGALAIQGAIRKYREFAICFNTLQFKIGLTVDHPPLTTPSGEMPLTAGHPAVKMTLKQPGTEEDSYFYEQFLSLQIERIVVTVRAENLAHLTLRNDFTVLDPKTPFEPFGNSPKIGSGFYFFHDEVCGKRLDQLTLKLDWMGVPPDFSRYYDSYFDGADKPDLAQTAFKSQLRMFDSRSWREVGGLRPLFELTDNPVNEFNWEGYKTRTQMEKAADDPLAAARYFKLELREHDFYHDQFPAAMSRIALHNAKRITNSTIAERNPPNLPYTPLAKGIALDYAASAKIDFPSSAVVNGTNTGSEVSFFRIHPFGSEPVTAKGTLLPTYANEGYLQIGLTQINPWQNISLLFQLAPGSSDPEQTVPTVTWECLRHSGWERLRDVEILTDSTHGLIDTGIIKLTIPGTAVSNNPMMPQGLFWLRGSVADNANAIPDIVMIHAQAAEARFIGNGNAADHLSHPLAQETIVSLANDQPSIGTVWQPYSSFQGRMIEDDRQYYTRISERLRHRQRAVSVWDFERLVLEAFPEIYKVKCLRSSELKKTTGSEHEVVIVVIPDISNQAPFFPLEPKAPLYLLKEIEGYLKMHASPFIAIKVKNPQYEQIRYRVTVRFKEGYDQGHYLKQLNEDLKRFLSPWAYEEQADIPFGSRLHSSTVIHFIEKRSYVRYVAMLKLIEHWSEHSEEPKLFGSGEQANLATVRSPDAILVSAPDHIIDLITKDNYEEEDFEGIGYMIIGTDFKISPPGPEFRTIGFMKIGESYQVY